MRHQGTAPGHQIPLVVVGVKAQVRGATGKAGSEMVVVGMVVVAGVAAEEEVTRCCLQEVVGAMGWAWCHCC
jgi:hypothetical protein